MGSAKVTGAEHTPGEPLSTEQAPIQKFRWSDYRVYPDTTYTYEVHPVRGKPESPIPSCPWTYSAPTQSAISGVAQPR